MFFGEPKKLFQAFIWKSIELDLIFCHCTQEKWGNMVSGSSLGKQECKSAIESNTGLCTGQGIFSAVIPWSWLGVSMALILLNLITAVGVT